MSWQSVFSLLIGASVATVGALTANPALLALGSTIVGGVVGVSLPVLPTKGSDKKQD